jgi:hypothetical protein
MRHRPPNWRRPLRRYRGKVNVIITLAMINLFTGIMSDNFVPWFLIPAFFIALPIIQDFVSTLLDIKDDEEEVAEKDEETTFQTEAQPTFSQTPRRRQRSANAAIQTHLDKARTYKEQIEAFIQSTSDPYSQARLKDLSEQVNEWMEAIEAMGRRVDNFQQNMVIHQDLETVPRSIEKLEIQLANETDEAIRAELERTLSSRKHQLATLQRLQNTMKQAEIKIESTLASLGTIYSQLLTGQSTDHVADYSRLSTEVNEEVRILQDHLEALEEVKLGRG